VAVLEREREDREIPEVAALNDLALAAGVKRLGQALVEDLAGLEIKTAAGVSIYLFDDPRHGLDFCRKLRQSLAQQGVQLRIGMDVGRVLVFELGAGLRDIAGSPVNIASKLAQDVGEFGRIQLTTEAARRAGLPAVTAARTVKVAGVTLEVVQL
jgi:class 3 adenylate cyclase